MSGRYQTSLVLMLIMVAAVSEANIIGRYSDNSDIANYYFGLAKQLEQRALENCPTCPDCPAPPTCPTCQNFILKSSFTVCPDTFERTAAREGVIDLAGLPVKKCHFAIGVLSPYTKVKVKCPSATRTLGTTGVVNTFILPALTGVPLPATDEVVVPSPGVFLQIDNQISPGSVKCTWVAE